MLENWLKPKPPAPQAGESQQEVSPERPKELVTEERIAQAEDHLRGQLAELNAHNAELKDVEGQEVSEEQAAVYQNAYEKAADAIGPYLLALLAAGGAASYGEFFKFGSHPGPEIGQKMVEVGGVAGAAVAALAAVDFGLSLVKRMKSQRQ